MDQSSTLRKMAAGRRAALQDARPAAPRRATQVLTVTSGKGGVGKSNLVLNAAIVLSRRKKKVLILDADMGLANIDILIGMASRYNLSHVLSGEMELVDVIGEGPSGIHVLPASSGVEWMANLTVEQKHVFVEKMDGLNGLYDVVLIDTGAGISSNVTYFNLAAQTRIVIVTPEPTSLTDAYALIKVLHQSYHQKEFEVVVNFVGSEKEALEVYRNLTTVADRFLDVRLGYMGHIERDDHLRRAVLRQSPVVDAFPEATVSRCYEAIARRIAQLPTDAMASQIGLFWRKMLGSTSS